MKLIKKLLFSFALTTFVLGLQAQDIHFTQFYMSPLNLNPAMTGVMNCKNRFIMNFRNQWASVLGANAYNTYSFSYDQKTPVGRDDYFGIGGTLWSDVAGESRFGTTQGRVSFAYSKKMAGYRKKASYLVLGADAGITQRRISDADLRWPSQISAGGIVSGPGEIIDNQDFLYPDLSVGGLWFSIIDNQTNWYIGAAVHHINQPNVSFFGAPVNLYTRSTIHFGAQFPVGNKTSLLPFGVYMTQGPHRALNAGANLRFLLGPSRLSNQAFDFGAWYRIGRQVQGGLHSDAFILSTRFQYEQFGIGFSYDINVSRLAIGGAANGAFEFSLSYDICGPENRGVYCPRF
jgi:type IX secretion system PorP/SprF family membrane protein